MRPEQHLVFTHLWAQISSERSTQCPSVRFPLWFVGASTVPSPVRAPRIVLSSPFEWLLPWFPVVSSHAGTGWKYCRVTLYRAPELCVLLSPFRFSVLCPRLLASSFQCRDTARLQLPSSCSAVLLKSLQAVGRGILRAHLLCFPTLKSHYFSLSGIQCLENPCFICFVGHFSCFR